MQGSLAASAFKTRATQAFRSHAAPKQVNQKHRCSLNENNVPSFRQKFAPLCFARQPKKHNEYSLQLTPRSSDFIFCVRLLFVANVEAAAPRAFVHQQSSMCARLIETTIGTKGIEKCGESLFALATFASKMTFRRHDSSATKKFGLRAAL
jgi:hypothetical protein